MNKTHGKLLVLTQARVVFNSSMTVTNNRGDIYSNELIGTFVVIKILTMEYCTSVDTAFSLPASCDFSF